MGGPIVVKPKEEEAVKTIKTVEFKVGGKTYMAKFEDPPKIGEVEMPKVKSKKPKDIDAAFIDMVKEYGAKIYAVDATGKETALKDPSEKMLADAGKALLKKSVVYSAVLKKT